MVGTLTRCWLFAYRTSVDHARSLLPPQLEVIEHRNCAFWNVVVCQVDNMRPKLSPLSMGVTYWHVAYRLYVRFRPRNHEPITGLYFLRSDCDNPLLALAGNVLTDFNFHCASVSVAQNDQSIEMKVAAPDGDAYVMIKPNEQPQLPADSVFGSLEEAAGFLKYQPNGISIEGDGRANVVHILRDEQAWRYKLVSVEEARWSFFKKESISLEICYQVEPVFYQWNKARIYDAE